MMTNLLSSSVARLRFLLVMLVTLCFSAEVWGAEKTVSWTASNGALGSEIGSGTIKTGDFLWNYTRTLKSGASSTGFNDNSQGAVRLGKNGGIENITFTTSDIPGMIKSIIVECASYQGKHNLSINVGGNAYYSNAVPAWGSGQIGTVSSSGNSSGIITISFTDGSRALYIKSISVTYEEAAATVPVTGVSLDKSTLTLTEGDSETLTATVAPANATDKTVTWSTSDANFATVSNGKVTAVAEGSATITVTTTDGGKTATCDVTVNPKPKYTVTLNAGSGTCEASVTETSAGAGVTLPEPTLDCGDWEFAGWKTTSAVTTETTTEPTLIPAGNYKPSNNITLYAVYQRIETTSGGGGGESHSITITPNIFTNKGSNNYGSGAERIGSENAVNFGGHYITGNVKNTPSSGATAGTYLQCQANNATIYNKTELPGKITKIVVNQHEARAFSLYCGKEQLVASDNTNTGVTPSGTKITDTSSATTMTWNVSGDYTFFAIKKGNNASYVTSIVITYQTDGGQSETTYYHSTPDCGTTEPSRCVTPKMRG